MKEAITISLKILAVYVVLSEGYALHFVKRNVQGLFDWLFGMKAAAVITAPLFNCYVCMSSVWTVVFAFVWSPALFHTMLLVLAFNFIIAMFYETLTGEEL
jgi:hypothetical protein